MNGWTTLPMDEVGRVLGQVEAPAGGPSQFSGSDIFMWGAILIGVVVTGGGMILMLRRKLRDAENSKSPDAGFSLSELKAMRNRGEITIQEYEQTRARVIAKVKNKMRAEEENAKKAAIDPAEAELYEGGESLEGGGDATGKSDDDSSPPEPPQPG